MKQTLAWLFVAVLVVLTGYAVYLQFLQTNDASPPFEVVLGTRTDASVFELNEEEGVLTEVELVPGASVVSRTRNHEANIAVSVITPEGQLGNFVLLETSDGPEQLTDSSSIKDWATVSSDGQYVAYAELNLVFGSTLFSNNVVDWNVRLLDRNTGSILDLGVGYGPTIVNSGDGIAVIYTSPNGINSYSPATGDVYEVLPEFAATDTTNSAHVSPDGSKLLIFNDVTSRYNLFELTGTLPVDVSGIGGIPVVFEQVALTNDRVYGIHRNQETNEYTLEYFLTDDLEIPGSVGQLLYSFTNNQLPYQIIP